MGFLQKHIRISLPFCLQNDFACKTNLLIKRIVPPQGGGMEIVMQNTSIIIAGVGGQGSLLASKLLGHLLLQEGFDVKVSEVHGMSQRGGSVVTYVRFGNRIYSPIIDRGEADYIVSFECMEAARRLPCLKKGGTIIVNTQKIDPMPVIIGAAKYPDGILDNIKKMGVHIDAIDALSLAGEAGSIKAVNIVLLSRLATYFPFAKETWLKAIEETVAPKFKEMNQRAFLLGWEKASV